MAALSVLLPFSCFPKTLVFGTGVNDLDCRCHKPCSKPKTLLKVFGRFLTADVRCEGNFIIGARSGPSLACKNRAKSEDFEPHLNVHCTRKAYVAPHQMAGDLSGKPCCPRYHRSKSMVQFVSQVLPPSFDMACSHLGDGLFVFSHRNRT